MNIGDKIGLRNMHGDVVVHEVVSLTPAKVEAEYPRVYRSGHALGTRVWLQSGAGKLFEHGTYKGVTAADEIDCMNAGDLLLTGPERDEYVAAAREGRDAVWPKPSDPWPHWFTNEEKSCVWRFDSLNARGTVFHRSFLDGVAASDPYGYDRHIRIDPSEAARIQATWKAEREGKGWPRVFGGPKLKFVVYENETIGWSQEHQFYAGVVFDKADCVRMGFADITDTQDGQSTITLASEWREKQAEPALESAESVAEKLVLLNDVDGDYAVKLRGGYWLRVAGFEGDKDKHVDARDEMVELIAAAITADRRKRGGGGG